LSEEGITKQLFILAQERGDGAKAPWVSPLIRQLHLLLWKAVLCMKICFYFRTSERIGLSTGSGSCLFVEMVPRFTHRDMFLPDFY